MILQGSYFIKDHKIYFVNQLIKVAQEYVLFTFRVINAIGEHDRNQTVTIRLTGPELEYLKKNLLELDDLKNYPHYFI